MERRNASGILEKRCGVSGAFVRSGRKKFLTANMLIDCNGTFAVAVSFSLSLFVVGVRACWQWKSKTVCGFYFFFALCFVVFLFCFFYFFLHVCLFSCNPFWLRIYLLISCALIEASATTTILQLVWLCFAFCILACGRSWLILSYFFLLLFSHFCVEFIIYLFFGFFFFALSNIYLHMLCACIYLYACFIASNIICLQQKNLV